MNENITNENLRKPMDFDALERTVKSLDENTRKFNEMIKKTGFSDPNVERLNELISDEEYCKKLFELESAEEVQRVLAQDGAELSVEYVNALGEYIFGLAEHLLENGGELSEDELESVAGGHGFSVATLTMLGIDASASGIEIEATITAIAQAAGLISETGSVASGVAGGVAGGGAVAGGAAGGAAGGGAAGGGAVASAGLSTGACIGIAAGVVVAAALIGVGVYFAIRQRW